MTKRGLTSEDIQIWQQITRRIERLSPEKPAPKIQPAKAAPIKKQVKTDVDPIKAFKIGEKAADPVTMYLEDIYTVPVNLAGLPSVSFQGGMSEGLPVGLQLTGNYFSEAKLLNVVHQFQQATDWHQQTSTMMES